MLFSLLIGAVVISLYISILQSRPFYNGPNIDAQAEDFRPNGSNDDLRKDTLATLKISYQENVKIINQKAKLFKMSIRGICLYFIILACYFFVLKVNEKEIPNDILLWDTPQIMTIPENQIPETLLTTDNLGAMEANPTEIEATEEENTEQALNAMWISDPSSVQPNIHREETPVLQSENVDVSEDTDAQPV